ncbi:MAG: hypothetical protein ABW077_19315, partial [Candidatus Thiodiazotropha endolucinida]
NLLLQVTGFILPTLHLEAGIGYQYSNSTIQGKQEGQPNRYALYLLLLATLEGGRNDIQNH